jgi:hypothetical protein
MHEKQENPPFPMQAQEFELELKDLCHVTERAVLRKTIIRKPVEKTRMNPQDRSTRAYVLVEIQPGKEKEFREDILSRGLLINSKGERMDFVHGAFDFVIILSGAVKDIDRRIIEIRRSPFVVKTETLI